MRGHSEGGADEIAGDRLVKEGEAQTVVVRGHQRSPEVIRGHQGSSGVI